jgi:hypothetical protein
MTLFQLHGSYCLDSEDDLSAEWENIWKETIVTYFVAFE